MSELKVRRPRLRVRDFVNDATPEETAEAKQRINDTLTLASLRGFQFVSMMLSRVSYHVPATKGHDTMAVTKSADESPWFIYNPRFTNSLRDPDENTTTPDALNKSVLFILYHECLHLLSKHLDRNTPDRNQRVWTTSTEAFINYLVKNVRLKLDSMPMAVYLDEDDNETVQPTGVDPDQVYDKYVSAAEEAGLSTVSMEEFYASDESVYAQLMRLPQPPENNSGACRHLQLNPDSDESGEGSGQGSGQSQAGEPGQGQAGSQTGAGEGEESEDGEGAGTRSDELVSEVLRQMVNQARNGNEKARQELLELAENLGQSETAQKMWGAYGVHSLRGKSESGQRTNFWKQWLNGQVASRTMPGERLVLPEKRAGVWMTLGQDPMFTRVGDEQQIVVDVFTDVSGSVPQEVVDYLAKYFGEMEDTIIRYYLFDHVVVRHTPGAEIPGGGGTTFQHAVDIVEERLELEGDDRSDGEPDVVLMVTDAYAAPVQPENPDKWIWLITPGGDESPTWIDDNDMDWCPIDIDEE